MIYQLEYFDDVIEELKPHLHKHYEEVAMYTDKIDLDPDYDMYGKMQNAGVLAIFTMRENDTYEIAGYNIFFVKEHVHYKNDIWAGNDIVYIAPEYRHEEDTIRFFEYCERQLKEEWNAHVVSYHMKTMKTFTTLMEYLGMDHAEHVYTKYIG